MQNHRIFIRNVNYITKDYVHFALYLLIHSEHIEVIVISGKSDAFFPNPDTGDVTLKFATNPNVIFTLMELTFDVPSDNVDKITVLIVNGNEEHPLVIQNLTLHFAS